MITSERLAEIEAEANAATTKADIDDLTRRWELHVSEISDESLFMEEAMRLLWRAQTGTNTELIAEVRRLQAENARAMTMATDYQALAAHREGEIDTLKAALKRADEDGAAAIERTSNAVVADKWNATAEFQARALKAEAEIARLNVLLNASVQQSVKLEQDLEDARRMYREDVGREVADPEGEPCEVCGDPACDGDSCGAEGCIHGLDDQGDECRACGGKGSAFRQRA